jgi:coatomer subunit beta'
LKKLAMEVSTDPDHEFELAIQLDDLERALDLVRKEAATAAVAAQQQGPGGVGATAVQHKWRTVGDRALAKWQVELAEECFEAAGDLAALLLMYTSTGDQKGLEKLAKLAGWFPSPYNCDDVVIFY